MPDKKTAKKKIRAAKQEVDNAIRFNILRMPEDKDEAPHWLFSVLVLALIALAIALVWEGLSVGSSVEAYLPYL